MKQCPNCRRKLYIDYFRSKEGMVIKMCPKSKGGCGWANVNPTLR